MTTALAKQGLPFSGWFRVVATYTRLGRPEIGWRRVWVNAGSMVRDIERRRGEAR